MTEALLSSSFIISSPRSTARSWNWTQLDKDSEPRREKKQQRHKLLFFFFLYINYRFNYKRRAQRRGELWNQFHMDRGAPCLSHQSAGIVEDSVKKMCPSVTLMLLVHVSGMCQQEHARESERESNTDEAPAPVTSTHPTLEGPDRSFHSRTELKRSSSAPSDQEITNK